MTLQQVWNGLTLLRLAVLVPTFCFLYLLLRSIYRLTLHPLAKFPGPKLTAVTRLYEGYWELIADGTGGKFTDKIEEWHQTYGPIIRINPHELHVIDPEYYDELFNFSPKLWKAERAIDNLIHTVSSQQHKVRRSALGNHFSRASTDQMMYIVHERIAKLCEHYESARHSGLTVRSSLLYRALNHDITCEYVFGKSWHFLENPDWSNEYFMGITHMFKRMWLFREFHTFNRLANLLAYLPSDWFKKGSMHTWTTWTAMLRNHIKAGMDGNLAAEKRTSKPTIIEEYRRNKLPPEEKTVQQVFNTSVNLLGAGAGSPSYAQDIAHFHILANPALHKHLKAELEAAWPDVDAPPPPMTVLEKLPYLRGCVKEAMRLGLGPMTRLPRVNPFEPMQYKDWTIPKGTPVGMTHKFLHLNPDLFADPWSFNPERWFDAEKSKQLDRYWVPFSRGSRVCLAIPLANAQVYMAIAVLFRRFDMELFDTDRDCVDAYYDFSFPYPKRHDLNTGRVRVIVK